jgi:hypothetical protein
MSGQNGKVGYTVEPCIDIHFLDNTQYDSNGIKSKRGKVSRIFAISNEIWLQKWKWFRTTI